MTLDAGDACASRAGSPSYLFFQPELERGARRMRARDAGVAVHRGWVAEGLDQRRGRRDAHPASPRGRAGQGLAPTERDAHGHCPLGRRRRRRQLVRARGGRHRPSRPRLPGALAGRRRRAERHGRPRRTCRPPASGATRGGRRPTSRAARGTAAGSSCCCRARVRGLRRPGARLVAARAVVHARRRAADAHRGLRVPLDAGRANARRATSCSSATPPT